MHNTCEIWSTTNTDEDATIIDSFRKHDSKPDGCFIVLKPKYHDFADKLTRESKMN